MLNALTALQTNVVATVRRDQAELRPNSSGLSERSRQQALQQPAQTFTVDATPATTAQTNSALQDQIAELIAVAQASAQSAAGIEPKASNQSLYGRAAAAYQQISGYGQATPQPLLNLAI